MALIPNFTIDTTIAYDPTGQSINFIETTGDYNATSNTGGYGTPNPTRASVQGVELIISSTQRELNVGNTLSLLAFFEYLNGSGGTITIDGGKTVNNNIVFANHIASTITASSVSNTGRYYIPNSYLPTTANLKINQTDAQFTSGSPFPDGAYSMQYNVYGGTAGTSGTLSANTWYYVVTTNLASYITVANNGEDVYGTFYNKQSFKTNSAGTTTFTTTGTGTIAVYPQLGTVTKIFGISYSAYLLVQSVNVKNAQNKCECGKDFTEKIDKLDVLYNSLAFLISPTYASPSAYDSTIQEINLLANEILSCYCS